METTNQTETNQNLTSEQQARMDRSKAFWKDLAEFKNRRSSPDDIIEDCVKVRLDNELTMTAIKVVREFQEWLDHAYGEDERKPNVILTISYWTIAISLDGELGLWFNETDCEETLTLEHLVAEYRDYVETLVEPFMDKTPLYDENE